MTEKAATPHATDHVAGILDEWAAARPDLDVSAMGIIGRLHRLAAALNDELRVVFAEEGLSDGEFDILAALRRSGDPGDLTPGELAARTMVTSGAVTKRVDRLEDRGLLQRQVCVEDARSRRVALTETGRELIDRLVERHAANEARLISHFTATERDQLTALLKAWCRQLGV